MRLCTVIAQYFHCVWRLYNVGTGFSHLNERFTGCFWKLQNSPSSSSFYGALTRNLAQICSSFIESHPAFASLLEVIVYRCYCELLNRRLLHLSSTIKSSTYTLGLVLLAAHRIRWQHQ